MQQYRIVISIVLIFLIFGGLGLASISKVRFTTNVVSTQTTVCTQNYSIRLDPSLVTRANCVVNKDSWVNLSLASSSSIVVTIWLNQQSGNGSSLVVYNASGSDFSANFPLLANGLVVEQIKNAQSKPVTANGYINVFAQGNYDATTAVIVHPYRTLGYALAGLSALGAFLVIWNPGKILTRTVVRLRGRK